MILSKKTDSIWLGILTTFDNPIYLHTLEQILNLGLKNIALIFDAKKTSNKDLALWRERTGGFFDGYSKSLHRYSEFQIPCFFVESHNHEDCVKIIKTRNISILLNAGTPRKLSQDILDSVQLGVVNVHPGILPFYRGSCAVEWAIFYDSKVGNTAHLMTSEYDAGRIISSEDYVFSKNDDYQDIRNKVLLSGSELAARVIVNIHHGKLDQSDFLEQDLEKGKVWPPIPDELLEQVKQKLLKKNYKYQILE